ncbi:MAG: DUF4293 family protein, partial [Bacteroidota bacterium]
MIQRPQSLFLLIAALSTVMATMMPLWSNMSTGTEHGCIMSMWPWQATSLRHVLPAKHVSIVAAFAALAATYAIFQYHDRTQQLRLGAASGVSLGYTIANVWLLITSQQSNSFIETVGQCQPGFWLLLVALLSNLLA